MTIQQLIKFCVLMENGNGIIDKSPDYVLEKFERCKMENDPDLLLSGLDSINRMKVLNWLMKWGIENRDGEII